MSSGIYKRTKEMYESRRGVKHTKEHCKKISEGCLLRKQKLGYINSSEARAKLSKTKTGTHLSKEHKASISKTKTGKKLKPFTQEHCHNMSNSKSGVLNPMFGKPAPNRGKHHSRKTREKISIKAMEQYKRQGSCYGKKGHFFSVKNNKNITFYSTLEEKFIKFCENNDSILTYSMNPFWIKYIHEKRKHNYLVDAIVTYSNDKKELIEVKYVSDLKDKKVQAKAKAAKKYCEENNMEYKFFTENGFIVQ